MTHSFKRLSLATCTALGVLCSALPASAQVAGGSTTVDTSVTETTKTAMGWSAKKKLLGRTLYNEVGDKVGKVEDLIISPDRNVSYLIVGAGGFVGIGRHDVAIPVSQIQGKSGKLVMAGATKESIKSLPAFVYAPDTSEHDAFVAVANKDIARGQAVVDSLQAKSASASADAKVKIDADRATVVKNLNLAQAKLAEMQQASVDRWREFESEVSAAMAGLRRAVDKAST